MKTTYEGRVTTKVRTAWFANECLSQQESLRMACANAKAAERDLFQSIIKKNALSKFGYEHHFSQLNSIEDYRECVPIFTYDYIEPWITRITEGEKNVLTTCDPYMLLKTSGTTGSSKYIPQNLDWRLNYRGPAIYSQWGAYLKYHPDLFSHSHSVMDLSWEREAPSTFIGDLPYQSITHRQHAMGEGDWLPPWYEESWFNFVNKDIDYMGRIYQRIRCFADRNLRAIVSVNPSTIVALANHLESHTEVLIKDIRDGTLFGKRLCEPNPVLARHLEKQIMFSGKLKPFMLWPNLNLLVCWKSASAELYIHKLSQIFPDAEILPFSTTGTEGVVTLPVDRHPTSGVLAITQGLYEFIPNNGKDEVDRSCDTLGFDELTVGHTYRIVFTQANGLYRYTPGDLYKVVEYVNDVPRLEFIGRDGHYSSFTGEKLTEQQIVNAAKRAFEENGIEVNSFTCAPVWDTPPYYHYIVEPKRPASVETKALLTQSIEASLAKVNNEYGGKRASGRLGSPRVDLVPARTFQIWWNVKVSNGASGAQVKHRWLQKDDAIVGELLQAANQTRSVSKAKTA